MSKHNKSKFGKLFEESLKESSHDSDQFIKEKSEIRNDDFQLSV